MLTVVETPEFSAWAHQVWSGADREAFIDWIASHPEAGEVIPGAGGCVKCVGDGQAWASVVGRG
jgi:hypothetical protein